MIKKKWGSYKVLARGKGWKLKLLTIKPYGVTSVQKHFERAEFWVYLDKDPGFFNHRLIKVSQEHKLENNTYKPMRVIELQFGKRCIERDIYRIKEDR